MVIQDSEHFSVTGLNPRGPKSAVPHSRASFCPHRPAGACHSTSTALNSAGSVSPRAFRTARRASWERALSPVCSCVLSPSLPLSPIPLSPAYLIQTDRSSALHPLCSEHLQRQAQRRVHHGPLHTHVQIRNLFPELTHGPNVTGDTFKCTPSIQFHEANLMRDSD